MIPEKRAKLQKAISSLTPEVRNSFIRIVKSAQDDSEAAQLAFDMIRNSFPGDPSEIQAIVPSLQDFPLSEFLEVLQELFGGNSQTPEK